MSWREFEKQSPELASDGAERLTAAAACLATTKKDGSPRVHPVAPYIGEGRLFIFINEPVRRRWKNDQAA